MYQIDLHKKFLGSLGQQNCDASMTVKLTIKITLHEKLNINIFPNTDLQHLEIKQKRF